MRKSKQSPRRKQLQKKVRKIIQWILFLVFMILFSSLLRACRDDLRPVAMWLLSSNDTLQSSIKNYPIKTSAESDYYRCNLH